MVASFSYKEKKTNKKKAKKKIQVSRFKSKKEEKKICFEADNLPSPLAVVTLLKASKIRNIRIYDADHSVLTAFRNTGIEIIVGLGNEFLKDINVGEDQAMNWVKENVEPFIRGGTKFSGIAVGNEILGGTTIELWEVLLPAAKNVIVSETGWASKGDADEAGATAKNARTYNRNLIKRLKKRKGTPYRPHMVARAYVFALFNEDLKPGPTSKRNFGLFKPDGSIVYDIGFTGLEYFIVASGSK
ncbi:hypothetical protein Bca101_083687 [Brassica carinata]